MTKDLLIDWLNDSYAMEKAQIETLERVIDDFSEFSDVQTQLRQHLDDTKDQLENVESMITSLGGSPSKLKSAMGALGGAMQGMVNSPYKDEVIKNAIMLHASEHFEHATYIVIASAAEMIGEENVAQICWDIAEEEREMGEWIEERLPDLVEVLATRGE